MIRLDGFENYCKNCFRELTEGSVCPHCQFDNDTENASEYLPLGHMLAGRYVIGRMISRESDGAVYSAYDKILKARITVKEYMPQNLSSRLEGSAEVHVRERFKEDFDKYKKAFSELWQTLEKMRSLSAIVPVYDVFEANGTAYAVCEYIENVPLREYLLRQTGNRTDWQHARIMFMPVLTTIENLHARGMIHGAICPDNLLLCRDGKVRLSGFVVSDANRQGTALAFNEKPGYTALEQYENAYKIGPHTDIYAFTACIYRALVGNNPPDAISRQNNDKLMIPNAVAEKMPVYVIRALGSGLQIRPERRTKTAEELRERLDASPSVAARATGAARAQGHSDTAEMPAVQPAEPAPQPAPQAEEEAPPKKKQVNTKAVIIACVVVIVLAVAAVAGVLIARQIAANNEPTDAVSVQTFEVPDFSTQGYTREEIQQNAAWNSQFNLTYTEDYNSDVDEGIVFAQSIAAGQTVDQGTEIVLTVSRGTHMETLPDVGGMTEEDARSTLTKLGFTVTVVEVANDGTHTEGTVKTSYGMSPTAGTSYEVGSEVIIQVYGKATTASSTTEPPTESTTEDPTEGQIVTETPSGEEEQNNSGGVGGLLNGLFN